MNKLNRKGFTLIEMLVVIAIIAVLVAIIVPTVSNATEKSKAAADAANLRTYAAALAIESMEGTPDYTGIPVPASKLDSSSTVTAVNHNGNIKVYFNSINSKILGVEKLASIADGSATLDTVAADTIPTKDVTAIVTGVSHS